MIKRILCVLLVAVMLPVLPVSAGTDNNIYGYRKNDKMEIALTFDDGPHPKYTVEILDLLKEYGVKATFFVVGKNAERYPDILRRIYNEGHEIGNHTFTHARIPELSKASLEAEVNKCEDVIFEITGSHSVLFRPPEGVVDDAVKVLTQMRDYSLILWRVDTRDWAGTSTTIICNKVVNNLRSGDIILMHDYILKSCHTVEALEQLLPLLLDKGYKFVTVSHLIGN